MRARLILALAFAALLAGCAAQPTPYVAADPARPHTLGFQSDRVEDNRFRVRMRANRMTPPETVTDQLLYRAAEVTLAEEADWFRIETAGGSPEIRRLVAAGPGPSVATAEGLRAQDSAKKHGHKRYRYKRKGRHRRRRGGVVIGFGFSGFYPYGFYPGWYYRPGPIVRGIEASAEIRLFTGEKPADDAAAYDARAVIAAIGPRLIRPAPG